MIPECKTWIVCVRHRPLSGTAEEYRFSRIGGGGVVEYFRFAVYGPNQMLARMNARAILNGVGLHGGTIEFVRVLRRGERLPVLPDSVSYAFDKVSDLTLAR